MTTAAEFLSQLDSSSPGLAVGAHVVGSRVLDDVVAESDLDLVVELSSVPDDLSVLTGPVDVDVIYVVAGELSKPVSSATCAAWARDGSVSTTPGELTPVLWEQLRAYASTVRGDSPSPPVSRDEVAAYCRENLISYWEPLLGQAARVLTDRDERKPVFREALWIAFGPARLWHTIRTGEIVGKSQAAALAADQWPDLAGFLREMVAARKGSPVTLTADHGFAALELGKRVLATDHDAATN